MKSLFIIFALTISFIAGSNAQPATLTITAEPGVYVYLNGDFAGITSKGQDGLRIRNLSAGKYSLEFTRKGYRSVEDKIVLAKNEDRIYKLPPLEPEGKKKDKGFEPVAGIIQPSFVSLDSVVQHGDTTIITGPAADTIVFIVVEDMPQYPGGETALYSYLVENIRYPDEAKKKKVSGRVFVTFVIERDGSVADVRLLKGIGGGCDEEALRVVRSMPKWTPGKQKGKPVRVQYNLPVKFTITGSE